MNDINGFYYDCNVPSLHAGRGCYSWQDLNLTCRWKWLFMLEGVLTVIFGILFYVSTF